MLRIRLRKWQRLSFFVILVIILLFLVVNNKRDLGYLTRPIWDSPGAPWTVLKHYNNPQVPLSDLCKLHGWTARPDASPYLEKNLSTVDTTRVWDATLFSFETDLLEIRLRELWDVVDHFILIEADLTFTGQPKPLNFKQLQRTERFQWAESKIIYETVQLVTPDKSKVSLAETAWRNEAAMRIRINSVLTRHGIRNGDLVIQSDLDEIPARSTVALLRACSGFPNTLHLSMRTYLYSFAFSLQTINRQASVKTYSVGDGWYYSHQRHSDVALDDAGWHCSFCFRYLRDFVNKMTGFSHFDRVTSAAQLKHQEIQKKICAGKDLFDMFPEAYTFKDLLSQLGSYPQGTSFISMPAWLLRHPQRFAFLLPNGCKREDFMEL